MADNKQIAADVLEAVGGPGNITQAMHCMTRLRLTLKDKTIPNVDEMKQIKGVLGVQWVGEQFQVIIGQNVSKVYPEILAAGVAAGGSVDENLDADAPKQKLTPKAILDNVLNYLSKTMVAAIPLMTGAAIFRTVAIILGPLMLGVISEDSAVYTFFNSWMFNAGFYFLPIYLGYTAAATLGATPVLGMMCGGVLMAPEMMDLVAAGETSTMVYGLFLAPVASYAQSVLPILLTVAVLYFVEKFFKKVVPETLSTVFVPTLTMMVVTPLSLCVLAPIGSWMGNLLSGGFGFLADHGGFVAVAIIAAIWQFLIITGMHVAMFGLILPSFMALGYDSCVLVAAWISVAAGWGMALGAFLRLKEPEEKAAQLGYFISGIFGGVNEPALYGCGFKYNLRPFIGIFLGGLVGGAFAGLMNVKFYVMGATNIVGLINYAGGGTQNLIFACISWALALGVAAAVTYFFGFTKEQLEADRQAAELAKVA
ncbi:MAG: PTS transporter subunit EIIC [Olsenella sp.]|nr:PTS transporter subunit EIIC [Olsenella sp.]